MTDYVEPVVVVIRLKSGGDDILAILNEIDDTTLYIEHPHYIKFDSTMESVSMVPYCPLSDEKYYEVELDTVNFTVPANAAITDKFFAMVNSIEIRQTQQLIEAEEPIDRLEAMLLNTVYVDGNDTKH